jgi:hypothetical protein
MRQSLPIPASREGCSGDIQDDSGNLLRDDVMDHVPRIRHLAERTSLQFRV